MKKRLLVVSQYFHPEQFRINDICCEWIKRGYEVSVLTGIPNYPQGIYFQGYGIFKRRRENYNGIQILRVPIFPRGNNGMTLFLNYFSFVISGWFFSVFLRTKFDLVFTYEVSPMTQALPAIAIAKKQKIPNVLFIGDLWPENIEYVAGIKSAFILNSIGKIVDYIYSKSDVILTSSQSFIPRIVARGVTREKIEHWPQYAEDFYKPCEAHYLREKHGISNDAFVIMFTGNIGYAQGLDILPFVAQYLKNKSVSVLFFLVGDGRAKKELQNSIASLHVNEYFYFLERRPAPEIPMYLAIADVALVCFSKGLISEITIPAKLQSYMACAKPLLVSGDGEVCKIIDDSQAGLSSPSGDVQMLSERIIDFTLLNKSERDKMSHNALVYYKNNYDKEKLLIRADEIFMSIFERRG